MARVLILALLSASLSACGGLVPGGEPPRQASVSHSPALLPKQPEARRCLADLGQARAAFTPLPDQYYGAGCTTLGTVRLASLRSDDAVLGLSNLGPVTCPLAETFAGWARFGVDRAAQQVLGSPVVRIETMGSYNCRNVAGSTRRSAHATASAIDVSGFVLADGRRITIRGDWQSQSPKVRQFLTVVHASACKRFGTVLGPAYNAAHFDHLHVELSGRALCR
ncbi:extensin-like protein [Novosphingobium kunmingense]|uniref:Extensin-like protein n=1 Tax=Novosphingobium kunmingense TaxID=1211806 RepID=A0A2N0H643_9SPHN|nr:extensin family protein [Novosphingobium kunmingense]PKB14415.1 extensin-like protein [Novosphingobium kunmingense]